MIDDVKCAVTATKINQIACRLGKKTTSIKTLLTNSTNQIDGFIGGSGFRYSKYNLGDLSDRSYQGLKDALDSDSDYVSIIEEGIVGEM